MNAMQTVIIGFAVALAAVIGYTVYLHQGPIKDISSENQTLLSEIDQLKTASKDKDSASQSELDAGVRREKELATQNAALEEAVARISQEKEVTEAEREKLVSQIRNYKQSVEDLNRQLLDSSTQLAQSHSRFQAISENTAAKDRKLVEMEENRLELLSQIESQQNEKEELQRLKNALRDQLGMTQSQIEALSTDAVAKEEQLKSMETAYRELSKQFEQQIKEKEIQISTLEDKLNIRLLDKILFSSGSADITSAGIRVLKSLATELKRMEGFEISVAGHTDNKPLGPKIKKIYYDNLGLSVARAAAVSRELRKLGVSPANLSATGYSMQRPVSSNVTADGRQQNRRVDVMLEPLR